MQIDSQFITLTLDEAQGTISLTRRDGQGFSLRRGAPVVRGDFGSVSAAGHAPRVREESFSDDLGKGRLLIVNYDELPQDTKIEWTIRIYEERPWVSLTANLKRPNGMLESLSPLESELIAAGPPSKVRMLVNSGTQMPSGSCTLESGGVVGCFVTNIDPERTAQDEVVRKESVRSEFVTALYDPASSFGAGLGFYSYRRAACSVALKPGADHTIRLHATGQYHSHDLAAEGGSMQGESLLLDLTLDPLQCLENYARAVELFVKPRFNHTVMRAIHNPWFIYGNQMTGANMLAEAKRLVKSNLFRDYGVTILSTGLWQKQHRDKIENASDYENAINYWGMGEENLDDERYSEGGLANLERKMRATGVEVAAGMFYAQAGSESTIRKNHPDWVINGRIDFSNPLVRDWLANIIRSFKERGAKIFWADFNDDATDGPIHDKRMVKGFENARAGMQVIRDVMGPEALIGTYTSPTNVFVGKVDRIRMALDMGPFGKWSHMRDIVRNMAAAYFFHQRMWINDPDPVFIKGTEDDPATLDEARLRVALIVNCGSVTATGEKYYEFTPSRFRLLTQAMPSYGHAARPLDLMRREIAEEFHMTVHVDWDDWDVITYVNTNDEAREYEINLKELGLAEDVHYLLYDFWPQQSLGELRLNMKIAVQAHASRVILIKKKPEHPWVLATDMHLLQGAVELAHVKFGSKTQMLSGQASRHPGADGKVQVFVPQGYKFVKANVPVEGDNQSSAERVIQFNLTFGRKKKNWEATFAATAQH